MGYGQSAKGAAPQQAGNLPSSLMMGYGAGGGFSRPMLAGIGSFQPAQMSQAPVQSAPLGALMSKGNPYGALTQPQSVASPFQAPLNVGGGVFQAPLALPPSAQAPPTTVPQNMPAPPPAQISQPPSASQSQFLLQRQLEGIPPALQGDISSNMGF